jgi:hypothetical protein
VSADGEGRSLAPAFDALLLDANPDVGGVAGSASADSEGNAFVDGEGLDLEFHGGAEAANRWKGDQA